jgi:hypothetical protein
MVSWRREVMVNTCLMDRQFELPKYLKLAQIFDFADATAYNAAPSRSIIPDES